jgi:zinc protease
MPDPTTQVDDYLAFMVLGDVLTEGDAARLQRRLVHAGLAHTVSASPLAGPFFVRHPDTWRLAAILAPTVPLDQLLDIVDDEINQIAEQPPTVEEITKTVTRWTHAVYAQCDDPFQRVLGLGLFELMHGQAELLPRMPHRLTHLQPESVSAAAKALSPDSRALYVLQPSGDPA